MAKKEIKKFVKDWKQEVQKEKLLDIVKDMEKGWWLFQTKPPSPSNHPYSGILGWHHVGSKGFFAIYDPEKQAEYIKRRNLRYKDSDGKFTDGRQLNWIAREFFPPRPRRSTIELMKQTIKLTDEELAIMENIRMKVKPYLKIGSPERAKALKVAKENRKMLQEKWGPFNKPRHIEMPENVKNTLILLNEEPVKK